MQNTYGLIINIIARSTMLIQHEKIRPIKYNDFREILLIIKQL